MASVIGRRTFLAALGAGAFTLLGSGERHRTLGQGDQSVQFELTGTAPMALGINDNPTIESDMTKNVGLLTTAGVTWVRLPVSWAALEPARGILSSSGLTTMGQIQSMYSSNGIQILWNVTDAPQWSTNSSNPYATPVQPADFANFMASMTAIFPKQYWELFNEPDGGLYFLPGGVTPTGTYAQKMSSAAVVYSALVKATFKAMKASDPHCRVVAGALGYPNVTFYNACVSAGIVGYYDCFSLHTYDTAKTLPYPPKTWDPTPSIEAGIGNNTGLNAFKFAKHQAGDSSRLWITELGWPAYPVYATAADPLYVVPALTQKGWLQNYLLGLRSRGDIEVAFVYALRDTLNYPSGISSIDQHGYMGVTNMYGSPKPAYQALQYYSSTLATVS